MDSPGSPRRARAPRRVKRARALRGFARPARPSASTPRARASVRRPGSDSPRRRCVHRVRVVRARRGDVAIGFVRPGPRAALRWARVRSAARTVSASRRPPVLRRSRAMRGFAERESARPAASRVSEPPLGVSATRTAWATRPLPVEVPHPTDTPAAARERVSSACVSPVPSTPLVRARPHVACAAAMARRIWTSDVLRTRAARQGRVRATPATFSTATRVSTRTRTWCAATERSPIGRSTKSQVD